MDESDVLALARRQDREAQRRLYEAHVEDIFRLTLRLTKDPHDAQDVTQDTFVRAFERIDSFDGRSAFATWLHRIAVNESLQRLRKRATERRHWKVLSEQARTDTPKPPTLTRLIVEDALERLTPEHRAVILLRYQEGLDYSRIAEILECPPGTVASRLNRAREELRGILEADASGEPGPATSPPPSGDPRPIAAIGEGCT